MDCCKENPDDEGLGSRAQRSDSECSGPIRQKGKADMAASLSSIRLCLQSVSVFGSTLFCVNVFFFLLVLVVGCAVVCCCMTAWAWEWL